jgi:hypothetical protein
MSSTICLAIDFFSFFLAASKAAFRDRTTSRRC